MKQWNEFLTTVRPGANLPKRVLALDPGDTTGWALFVDGTLSSTGQEKESNIYARIEAIHNLIRETNPTAIVCEDYRVYESKSKVHINSDLPTARLIGAIMLTSLLMDSRPSITFQSAGVAKKFCDNKKLKQWGLYQTSVRHSNDAVRHGCYYLLFGKKGA